MILAAILVVGSLFFRGEERVNRVTCAEHLRRIAMAAQMYAQDNEDAYPPSLNWAVGLAHYIDKPGVLHCPSDRGGRPLKKNRPDQSTTVSYWYLMPSDTDSQSGTPIFGDRMYPNLVGNHVDGGNVVYLDGHAKWRSPEQWTSEALPIEVIGPRVQH